MIINKAALARRKSSAFLLNFGRGDLVVDSDLVAAVSERRIAGAILDVYTTEPLPAVHAFWTMPGIVVLPHVGGLHPQRESLVPRCGESEALPGRSAPERSRGSRSRLLSD